MTTTTFEQFVMNDPLMKKVWQEEVCDYMGGLDELCIDFCDSPDSDMEDYENAVELLLRAADSLSSLLNKFWGFNQVQLLASLDCSDQSIPEVRMKLMSRRAKCEKVLEFLGKPQTLEFDSLPNYAENAAAVYVDKVETRIKEAMARAKRQAAIKNFFHRTASARPAT